MWFLYIVIHFSIACTDCSYHSYSEYLIHFCTHSYCGCKITIISSPIIYESNYRFFLLKFTSDNLKKWEAIYKFTVCEEPVKEGLVGSTLLCRSVITG